MTHLLIPERFNGPPHSANGGWFAGSVAQRVHAATGAAEGTAVRVRLMAPPPLEQRRGLLVEPLPVDHTLERAPLR